MRYHTKDYYRLMMAQGASDLYEPVIEKEYTDAEIGELYRKALDEYIDEQRALYDTPPEMPVEITADAPEEIRLMWEQMHADEMETYENRPTFDEDEAREEFEEFYQDNLEEPDEDLPDWGLKRRVFPPSTTVLPKPNARLTIPSSGFSLPIG